MKTTDLQNKNRVEKGTEKKRNLRSEIARGRKRDAKGRFVSKNK